MHEIKNAISKDELLEDLYKFRETLRKQLRSEKRFSYNHGHIAGEMSGVSHVINMLTTWGEKERKLFLDETESLEKRDNRKRDIHVVGAVISANTQILCAERGPSMALPYNWEFPGGKIECGETPEDALKREITEELRCRIQVGEQIEHTVYEYDFGVVHLTTYFCELTKGSPVNTEHHALEWVSQTELSDLKWAPADIPTVEKIVSMDLTN